MYVVSPMLVMEQAKSRSNRSRSLIHRSLTLPGFSLDFFRWKSQTHEWTRNFGGPASFLGAGFRFVSKLSRISRISWVHGGSRHSQILLNIFHQTHHLRTSSPFTVCRFFSNQKAIFLGIPFPLLNLCSSVCHFSRACQIFAEGQERLHWREL